MEDDHDEAVHAVLSFPGLMNMVYDLIDSEYMFIAAWLWHSCNLIRPALK